MRHKTKLFRLLSYFFALLLASCFAAGGLGIVKPDYLLYLAAGWFLFYGTLLFRAKSTSSLYKFFLVNNLFIILAGLVMYIGWQSKSGYLILAIALGMMTFIITFARKEPRS